SARRTVGPSASKRTPQSASNVQPQQPSSARWSRNPAPQTRDDPAEVFGFLRALAPSYRKGTMRLRIPFRRKALIPGERSITRYEHPTGLISLSEKYSASYDEIYRTQPTVRIIVDLIS